MTTKSRTVAKQLTTSNSVIYTVPARYNAEITSIIISNNTSSAVTFSLDWYDTASSTYYTVAKITPVIANGVIQITDGFYLQSGDSFRGLASTNSAITVTVRTEEDYSVVV
jgi:hypothetical protein